MRDGAAIAHPIRQHINGAVVSAPLGGLVE
jgi:hypothetical protein